MIDQLFDLINFTHFLDTTKAVDIYALPENLMLIDTITFALGIYWLFEIASPENTFFKKNKPMHIIVIICLFSVGIFSGLVHNQILAKYVHYRYPLDNKPKIFVKPLFVYPRPNEIIYIIGESGHACQKENPEDLSCYKGLTNVTCKASTRQECINLINLHYDRIMAEANDPKNRLSPVVEK